MGLSKIWPPWFIALYHPGQLAHWTEVYVGLIRPNLLGSFVTIKNLDEDQTDNLYMPAFESHVELKNWNDGSVPQFSIKGWDYTGHT